MEISCFLKGVGMLEVKVSHNLNHSIALSFRLVRVEDVPITEEEVIISKDDVNDSFTSVLK